MTTLKSTLLGSVVFAVVLLATVFAVSCFDVFALGHVDEKWGGPWANVQLSLYLYGVLVGRSSVVVFASGLFLFRSKWAASAPRQVAAVSTGCGIAGAVVAVSGVLKWLSQFIDARAGLQLASVAAIPGAVAVLVLAALPPFSTSGSAPNNSFKRTRQKRRAA